MQSARNNHARRGVGIKIPGSGRETLVEEEMIKTANIVQQDQAGVCNTFAQYAYMTLMSQCKTDRPFNELELDMIPSIKIVAHKAGQKGTHNFVLVGYDFNSFDWEHLTNNKDQFLIIDPWYYALGNKGEKGPGIYTLDEFPAGFLNDLQLIYDNQAPFTKADLEHAREIQESNYSTVTFFKSKPIVDTATILTQLARISISIDNVPHEISVLKGEIAVFIPIKISPKVS